MSSAPQLLGASITLLRGRTPRRMQGVVGCEPHVSASFER